MNPHILIGRHESALQLVPHGILRFSWRAASLWGAKQPHGDLLEPLRTQRCGWVTRIIPGDLTVDLRLCGSQKFSAFSGNATRSCLNIQHPL
jgi:hypothetical protein